MDFQALVNITLLSLDTLLPSNDAGQVAELRNHIITSRYLTEIGLANLDAVGNSFMDIKQLSYIILMKIVAENLYSFGWENTCILKISVLCL